MAEVTTMNKVEGESKILEEEDSSFSTASSITELNLAIILASLSLSPRPGDSSEFQDFDSNNGKTSLRDSKPSPRPRRVAGISHVKRRATDEFRPSSSPQSARFQTKIKDCRHGRRM